MPECSKANAPYYLTEDYHRYLEDVTRKNKGAEVKAFGRTKVLTLHKKETLQASAEPELPNERVDGDTQHNNDENDTEEVERDGEDVISGVEGAESNNQSEQGEAVDVLTQPVGEKAAPMRELDDIEKALASNKIVWWYKR